MTKLGTCEPYTLDFTAKAKAIDPAYKTEVNRVFAQSQQWSTAWPWSEAIAAKARGEIPHLTYKPVNMSGATFGNGEDVRAKSILAGLKAAGFTGSDILIGIYHESEDNIEVKGEFTHAQWCALQVKVLGIFKAAGFRTCVCLMNWTLDHRDVKKYLTPEVLAVTDVLAWDCYNYAGGGADKAHTWATRDPNTDQFYGDPAKLFGPALDLSKALGKPAAIFEVGVLRQKPSATLTDAASIAQRTKYWERVVAWGRMSEFEAIDHYENPDFASATAIRDEKASLAAFLKLRTPVVVDPCAAVKTELAAVKTELESTKALLTQAETNITAITAEKDALATRITEHEAHPV